MLRATIATQRRSNDVYDDVQSTTASDASATSILLGALRLQLLSERDHASARLVRQAQRSEHDLLSVTLATL